MNNRIAAVVDEITRAQHLIALTGAGVSTLSGIPDFRSPKSGLWNRYDAEKIFLIDHFYQEPHYFYNFAREFVYQLRDAHPNPAHNLLARLQKNNLLKRVITQNIDMLHQKAGNTEVLELHGSPVKNFCLGCGEVYSVDQVIQKLESESVPHCDKCGGVIKPDIIFFGEMLHEDVLEKTFQEARKCDCCLVMGTSLVVYPAASIPGLAAQSGAKIILVNREPTGYDMYADLTFHMDLGEFSEQILILLEERGIIPATE